MRSISARCSVRSFGRWRVCFFFTRGSVLYLASGFPSNCSLSLNISISWRLLPLIYQQKKKINPLGCSSAPLSLSIPIYIYKHLLVQSHVLLFWFFFFFGITEINHRNWDFSIVIHSPINLYETRSALWNFLKKKKIIFDWIPRCFSLLLVVYQNKKKRW